MQSIPLAAAPHQQQNAQTDRTAVSIPAVELPRPVSAGSRSYRPVLGASPPDGISLRPEVGFQREPDSVAAGEVCGLAGAGRGNFGVKRRSLEGASWPLIAEREAEPRMLRPFIGRVGLLCFCLRPQGVRLGKHNAFCYPPPSILNDSVGGRGGRRPLRLCSGRRVVGVGA